MFGLRKKQNQSVEGASPSNKKDKEKIEVSDFRAGIVVRNVKGNLEYREGTIYDPEKEALLGGWAEVYDHKKSKFVTVNPREHENQLRSEKTATAVSSIAIQKAVEELRISYADELLIYAKKLIR